MIYNQGYETNYYHADIRCNLPPTITDAVVQNENRDLILQKTIQKLNTIIAI